MIPAMEHRFVRVLARVLVIVVAEDTRYVGSIVPIRDGIMTALRIE